MRKVLTTSFLFVMAMAISFSADAQEFPDLDKSPLDMAYYPARAAFRNFAKTEEEKIAGQPIIRVLYSRPQKKGRVVFGELIKFGEPDRIGANESSEIMFMKPVTINGNRVPAGRYTFYATPTANNWEVTFSTDVDGWGAYAYNGSHNVASVTVPTEKSEEVIEALSIVFEKADDGAHMIIGWDQTIVRVPIQF